MTNSTRSFVEATFTTTNEKTLLQDCLVIRLVGLIRIAYNNVFWHNSYTSNSSASDVIFEVFIETNMHYVLERLAESGGLFDHIWL